MSPLHNDQSVSAVYKSRRLSSWEPHGNRRVETNSVGELQGVGAGSNQCALKAEGGIHILCWSLWKFLGLCSPKKYIVKRYRVF
jgi:hypothetical protein